jgi:hypothetical protein
LPHVPRRAICRVASPFHQTRPQRCRDRSARIFLELRRFGSAEADPPTRRIGGTGCGQPDVARRFASVPCLDEVPLKQDDGVMHFEVQSLGRSKLPATKVRMHRMVHDGAELLKAVEVDPSWVSIHSSSPFFRVKEQNCGPTRPLQ